MTSPDTDLITCSKLLTDKSNQHLASYLVTTVFWCVYRYIWARWWRARGDLWSNKCR